MHGLTDEARRAIEGDVPLDEFRHYALEQVAAKSKQISQIVQDGVIGLSTRTLLF